MENLSCAAKDRLLWAALIPFMALTLQWVLWSYIQPFVWFLFFPAVFFSARVGGFFGGILSTLLSTAIVWFFFIPPRLSWEIENPNNLSSVVLFMLMGYLLSDLQERLKLANQRTTQALDETRAANEKITLLYEKTRELDQLKTQFFANVSHELRTPLTLILGPVGKCLASDELSGQVRHSLEVVERNARFLYRHVTDLLDVAKLEDRSMTLHYVEVDLAYLIRVFASQFESVAADRAIRYQVATPERLTAQVDAEKLQRILLNLLSNAFKFTPDGGDICVELTATGEHARLLVSDNGPGIPADMREAVFERFRQLDGGAARRHSGTGLGLTIAKEFAELHGGSVTLSETPGGGARFAVELPLAAPAGEAVVRGGAALDGEITQQALDELKMERTSTPERVALSHKDAPLVLVVEDNPDMNAFLVATLSAHYRVANAFDGEEGLSRTLELRPDLILSDVMMPGMSGDQMIAALREHPEVNDTPVVMLTAKVDEALRLAMLKLGVQNYVIKPFSTDDVLARVAGVLAERLKDQAMQSQLAAIVASSDDAIIGNTPEGVITSWNPGAEKMFGYSADEAIGHPITLLFPAEASATEATLLDRVRRGESISHFDAVRICKDGRHIDVSVSVSPIRDRQGKVVGISKIVRDITQRKVAEMRLRRLAEVVERIAAVHDFAGLMAIVRSAARELTGADGATLVLRDGDQCHYVDEDAIGPLWKGQRFPLTSCISGWAMLNVKSVAIEDIFADERIPHAAYRPTFVKSLCMVPIGRVEPVGAIGCYWAHHHLATAEEQSLQQALADAAAVGIANLQLYERLETARQEAVQGKEEIHRLNTGLERRVEERTAELQAANRELDSFAYAVSHDLRAPLRAMSGFSQALREDYGDKLSGEALEFLDEISLASRKMGELIDGILTLSRITRGEVQRERVDLSGIAQAVRKEFSQIEPSRPVSWQIEPGLIGRGDPRMVEAVLRNLLGNAWKYTAHAEAPMVRLYADTANGITRFCVADNGAGFDMAHAEKLFKPFQRLHRQEEFPGIGIGLATVQRIVHRHGGEIQASAAPGQGATFCFSLPEGNTLKEENS